MYPLVLRLPRCPVAFLSQPTATIDSMLGSIFLNYYSVFFFFCSTIACLVDASLYSCVLFGRCVEQELQQQQLETQA